MLVSCILLALNLFFAVVNAGTVVGMCNSFVSGALLVAIVMMSLSR